VLRAEAAAGSFAPSDGACLDDPACVLRSGRHAALVHLFTEPDGLLAALEGESALPPLSTTECPIVVAPGLPGLARLADTAERALWQALRETTTVTALLHQGHSRDIIGSFLASGAGNRLEAPRSVYLVACAELLAHSMHPFPAPHDPNRRP